MSIKNPDLVYKIKLEEVSLIDVEEIKKPLKKSDVQVLGPTVDGDTHNELATILLLTLGPPALTAFTVWLMRTHDQELIELKITVRRPDGSEQIVELKIKRSSSKAPERQVIEQIAKALAVPEDAILNVSS
jgi:hypothetical protein